VSPNACVVLHEQDLSLVLDLTDGRLPAVVHWGARIEDLSAADAAVLVRAGIVPTAPNGVDDPLRLAVLPEHWSGWVGRPGVSGWWGAEPEPAAEHTGVAAGSRPRYRVPDGIELPGGC
jgi:alpha-galactosidase